MDTHIQKTEIKLGDLKYPAMPAIRSHALRAALATDLSTLARFDESLTLPTIFRQPELLDTLLKRKIPQEVMDQFDLKKHGQRKIYLVGTGTSWHAAELGRRLFRDQLLMTTAMSTTDFVDLQSRPYLNRDDHFCGEDLLLLVSHRGNKHLTKKAREIADKAYGVCVNIAGKDAPIVPAKKAHVLSTVPQETSSMHTASYTASVVMLAKLALEASRMRFNNLSGARANGGSQPFINDLDRDLRQIPTAIRGALEQWSSVFELARKPWKEVIFVGAGAEGITAREGALKLKEAAYLHAEGFDVESFLHGPILSVSRRALVILLRSTDPHGRMKQCAQALKDLGIAQWSIGPDQDFHLPVMTEAISALISVVPLQLFAAFAGLAREIDPGCFRLNDERYSKALRKVAL